MTWWTASLSCPPIHSSDEEPPDARGLLQHPWFVKPGGLFGDESVHELGVLVGSDYSKVQDDTDGPRVLTAMTDTSWIALSGSGLGDWGPVDDGTRTFDGRYSTSFNTGWTHVIGTATRILFYQPSGTSCIWNLVDGIEPRRPHARTSSPRTGR